MMEPIGGVAATSKVAICKVEAFARLEDSAAVNRRLAINRTEAATKKRVNMESLHDSRIAHRSHEPATDRIPHSLVRRFLGLDSREHVRPPSGRFLKSDQPCLTSK